MTLNTPSLMTLTTLIITICSISNSIVNTVAYSIPRYASNFSVREVNSSSKAGLAWPNSPTDELNQYTSTGKVSWYYSWGPDSIDADIEYVPMLWGERQIDQFTKTINDTISKRQVKAVLGFNEPQEKGQSNLTPQQGADMWKTYLEPLRSQGIRLGSPAPSGAPSGKIWIQDFLTACAGGCTVDFIALHWYDVNATQFIEYLEDFHNTFQKPIWVTEWACQNFNEKDEQCSQDDVVLLLNKTQSYMDQTDFVERYAWYGAMSDININGYNALQDSSGTINDLGKQYTGAQEPKTGGSGNADGPPSGGKGGDNDGKGDSNGGGGGADINAASLVRASRSVVLALAIVATTMMVLG